MSLPSPARRHGALGVACILAAALLPVSVRAQTQPSPSASASPAPEIGRVSTSDRQDEPISATARVTYIVTKSDIIRHGYPDIASALVTVPGVAIERYGTAGSGASLSIRGSSSNGVLVLLDGRPIAGSQIGTLDVATISTVGVERIEIVEGAGATLYGSGATGGIVNIITARGRDRAAAPLVTLGAGSFGERRASVELPSFSFERRLAEGAFPYPSTPGGAIDSSRTNAAFDQTTARFRSSRSYGALRLDFDAGASGRHLGVPGPTDSLSAYAHEDDTIDDARLTATLTRARAITTLDVDATRTVTAYRNPDPTVAFFTVSEEARVDARLRTAITTDRSRFVYGIDLAHGAARNDGGAGSITDGFAQSAVYAQDSVRLSPATRVYAGLRAERDGGAGGAITPSAGAVVGVGHDLTLRINAATAYRVPTAQDLTYPGFSNPLLKPERTRSVDATLNADGVLGGASFGYFLLTGDNLIVANPDVDYAVAFGPGNEPVINAQQAAVAGLTFDIRTVAFNGVVAKFNLTDTYRAQEFDPNSAVLRLARRPVLFGSLDLGYTGGVHSPVAALGLLAHFAGSPQAGADAYTRIDAYARLRLSTRALVSFRIFNLGNERYNELSDSPFGSGFYPAPGRAFALELSTR